MLIRTQIRRRETPHTGDVPKNIISYNPEKKGGGQNMGELQTLTAPVTHLATFKKLAVGGLSVMAGLTVSRMISGFIASRIPLKLPLISSRTLSGVATTMILYYAGHKVKNATLKDVLQYGAAGAAVFTAGSLIGDLLGKYLPASVQSVIGALTGASPVQIEAITE